MKKLLLLTSVFVISCSSIRPFPLRPIVWKDADDFRIFSPIPEEHRPATYFDGVDETILRPLPQLFAFNPPGRAENVNALDEVPDSSWFTNRIGKTPQSVETVSKGACSKPIDAKGPFEVLSGKPDGFNPGFLVKAPDGRKYFFKFDQHELQPERMSMAEVIGSLIYHSVGFTVPCYEVIYFDRSNLKLGKGATFKNQLGQKVPMTDQFIDDAFKLVKIGPDGKVRAVSSLLLEGKPLGPWEYWGTKGDDPNDVIDHHERREVRAGYVIASWIGHFDTRDQNTLNTWIAEKGKDEGYVRHNILDFGDSLGNLSDLDVISRRLGYTHYLDFKYFVGDVATLGVIERPWEKVQYGPSGPILGYYDVEHFDPELWRPGYPNPAFARMVESDAAWMARILSEFRDPYIDAIIAKGRIQDPIVRSQLRSTLIGRRNKLLARWFSRVSPLSHPEIRSTGANWDLCLRDLALYSGVVGPVQRSYEAKLLSPSTEVETKVAVNRLAQKVAAPKKARKVANEIEAGPIVLPDLCLRLPEIKNYSVLEVLAKSTRHPNEKPLRIHLAKSESALKIVGVERPE